MPSFKPEFLLPGINDQGNPNWAGNGLRFATREECDRWGTAHLYNWTTPIDVRTVESQDPVNYALRQDGSIYRLEEAT